MLQKKLFAVCFLVLNCAAALYAQKSIAYLTEPAMSPDHDLRAAHRGLNVCRPAS